MDGTVMGPEVHHREQCRLQRNYRALDGGCRLHLFGSSQIKAAISCNEDLSCDIKPIQIQIVFNGELSGHRWYLRVCSPQGFDVVIGPRGKNDAGQGTSYHSYKPHKTR